MTFCKAGCSLVNYLWAFDPFQYSHPNTQLPADFSAAEATANTFSCTSHHDYI